jgi:hypothetical protein
MTPAIQSATPEYITIQIAMIIPAKGKITYIKPAIAINDKIKYRFFKMVVFVGGENLK